MISLTQKGEADESAKLDGYERAFERIRPADFALYDIPFERTSASLKIPKWSEGLLV